MQKYCIFFLLFHGKFTFSEKDRIFLQSWNNRRDIKNKSLYERYWNIRRNIDNRISRIMI